MMEIGSWQLQIESCELQAKSGKFQLGTAKCHSRACKRILILAHSLARSIVISADALLVFLQNVSHFELYVHHYLACTRSFNSVIFSQVIWEPAQFGREFAISVVSTPRNHLMFLSDKCQQLLWSKKEFKRRNPSKRPSLAFEFN